jgi:hypothetical protein
MITEKVLKPTGAFAMMVYQFIGFIVIGDGEVDGDELYDKIEGRK